MQCQPLDNSQAEAIYSAMLSLNNINAEIKVSFEQIDGKVTRVEECDGIIIVTEGLRTVACYTSQAAFAAAYNLK